MRSTAHGNATNFGTRLSAKSISGKPTGWVAALDTAGPPQGFCLHRPGTSPLPLTPSLSALTTVYEPLTHSGKAHVCPPGHLVRLLPCPVQCRAFCLRTSIAQRTLAAVAGDDPGDRCTRIGTAASAFGKRAAGPRNARRRTSGGRPCHGGI